MGYVAKARQRWGRPWRILPASLDSPDTLEARRSGSNCLHPSAADGSRGASTGRRAEKRQHSNSPRWVVIRRLPPCLLGCQRASRAYKRQVRGLVELPLLADDKASRSFEGRCRAFAQAQSRLRNSSFCMALQPLSLVHAAYRSQGTNQRLCPGGTAGLPRSRLHPLFHAHMRSGWDCSTGANASLISSCLPQPVGAVGLPTRTAVSVDPTGIPPCALRRHVRTRYLANTTELVAEWADHQGRPHAPGSGILGASALMFRCCPAPAKHEEEASGVRIGKVLSKAYTRRTQLTLSLWREHVWARHTPAEEAMEARQKQARSPRPGCAVHKCTTIPAGETFSCPPFACFLSQTFL